MLQLWIVIHEQFATLHHDIFPMGWKSPRLLLRGMNFLSPIYSVHSLVQARSGHFFADSGSEPQGSVHFTWTWTQSTSDLVQKVWSRFGPEIIQKINIFYIT